MEREGKSGQKIVKTRETTGWGMGSGKIFKQKQDILKMEEDLKHQVIKAIFSQKAQAVSGETNEEQDLNGDHG